jgi:ABC-type branched-subunit amino acid transport system permease subunit
MTTTVSSLSTTLRQSLFIAVAVVLLTLTGIFDSFAGSEILENSLNLGHVLVVFIFAGTGLYFGLRQREHGLSTALLHGVVGSAVPGVSLAVLVVVENNIDMRFVFRNLAPLLGGPLTFGQESLATGLALLLLASVGFGTIGTLLAFVPPRPREIGFIAVGLTLVIALLQGQLDAVIALPDAIAVLVVFAAGYAVSLLLRQQSFYVVVGAGLALGLVVGGLLTILTNSIGLERGSLLRGTGSSPDILELVLNNTVVFLLAMTVIGGAGALALRAGRLFHDAMLYLVLALLLFGLLNWQDAMTALLAVLSIMLLSTGLWLVPILGKRSSAAFTGLPRPQQQRTRLIAFVIGFAVMLIAPTFAGTSLTATMVLVLLYVTMGIGLNVMVGYAGLLDLGYVASYAIGAYTAGVLTTPSLVTCGGLTSDQVRDVLAEGQTIQQACSGILTFWEAWPIAVIVSALTGVLLGVPVLRLRGDYLAIVTLGFGQIINRLVNSDAYKDLLGGPQGISNIPNAVLDLRGIGLGTYEFVGANGYYYLFLLSVLIAVFVVTRIINVRLGRAWRAMRADEDVAEAMGINLVQTKLLAFGLSSAFAGLGGAVFGAWLRSIFPNSFEIAVSINVLALIIIGGMGSVPGVIIGALVLVGIPELLRELQDYRLLAFGALLVIAMLLRPEGLLPPRPPRLAEMASEQRTESA